MTKRARRDRIIKHPESGISKPHRILRNCVMVARQTLTLFVRVQILLPQPGRARSRTRSGLFSCLCRKCPRKSWHLFQSLFTVESLDTQIAFGAFFFISVRSSRQSGIFSGPSCQAEPGAERAPGSFLIYAKRRPRLWPGVFFRSLFTGKARHCGAVKNFFQPPQEPSVLTGKNASGHMPKESFRTYPSP